MEKLILKEAAWKLLSPARRRRCVEHVVSKLGVSERLACRVLGQHRSTQRKIPMGRADEAALTADIIALATQYGRYGYRRIAALLHRAGWVVNVKRVERIWRRRGSRCCTGSRRRAVSGSTTAPAFGCDRNIPITFGPTTSSKTAPIMARSSGC